MAVPFKLTVDGFETQWQTNHLAHFLLTKELLPLLESTAASSGSKTRVRIVNLSADAAILPPAPKQLDFARPNLEYETGALSGWYVIDRSSLALNTPHETSQILPRLLLDRSSFFSFN